MNQRGIASGTAVASHYYFIDRWMNGEESSIAPKLSNNGIRPNGAIYQSLDSLASYVGKKMTFAVGLSSGNVVTASGTLTEATTGGYVSIFDKTDGSNGIAVGSSGGLWYVWIGYPSSTIQWAALYKGEYTAETLPEYQPKGYGAELAECRRYYREYDAIALAPFVYDGTLKRHYRLNFDTPMRVAPTVDVSQLLEKQLWQTISSSFDIYRTDMHGIVFATVSDIVSQSNCYVEGKLYISADL